MYKKSPEQKYRRKRLDHKSRSEWFNRRTGEWEVETWEWGHKGYQTEISKDGKEYVKMWKHRDKKWLRQYNNKRIRRYKGPISNGSDYKKLNEHWWIIY